MAEIALLTALVDYLAPRLAPARVGFAEPAGAGDLPAVILSLEAAERPAAGLGERSERVKGALPVRATIDLASPAIAGPNGPEPAAFLISADRRQLSLPHGGLVRNDGSDGVFAPADLTVVVDGAPRELVAGPPGPGQVRVEPAGGGLTFGAPLPAAGVVAADYFLGQWERELVRLAGRLRVDACAGAAPETLALSTTAVAALLAPEARPALRRLVSIGLAELGSIGGPEAAALGAARRRTARFRFEFEQIVDRPESAGGPIRRVRLEPGLFVDDEGHREPDDVVVVERLTN